MLEATHPSLVKKVKPLYRVAERETAAYCVLKGIDYVVEECPLVEGNTQMKYKGLLDALEAQSPGTKHNFLFGFLEKGQAHFPGRRRRAAARAPSAGRRRRARLCAFCNARRRDRAGDRPRPAPADVRRRPARAPRGPLQPGDRVQLTDPKGRLHTITLAAGRAVPHPPRHPRATTT